MLSKNWLFWLQILLYFFDDFDEYISRLEITHILDTSFL